MNREIGNIIGQREGTTVIFTAAIHGNEASGVLALQQVFETIERENLEVAGSLYGLIGNLQAYEQHVRFIDTDLNRMWRKNRSEDIENGVLTSENSTNETKEQVELYLKIKSILSTSKSSVVFVDLHSVSSRTMPFITINDMIRNRKLAKKIPVPIVLGIEEYIQGPLLNQVNALGHTAIGFEGGQHDDPATIKNQLAFIWLILHHLDLIQLSSEELEMHEMELDNELSRKFYDIRYRQVLEPNQQFEMKPGYRNFSKVKRGQIVARLNGFEVLVPFKGRLFMPLYQKKGEDGFFMVRRVFVWILRVSDVLRKISWTPFLRVLPGVRKDNLRPNRLSVNRRTARYFTIPIFHLLGYQCVEQTNTCLYFKQREKPPVF